MRVGNLEFLVSADTRSLDTSLRNSEGVSVAFAEKTSKQFKRVQADIEAVGKATGMSGAEMKRWEDQAKRMLAESAAAKAFERAAKAAGATTEEIKKASAAMGLTMGQAKSSFQAVGASAESMKNVVVAAGAAIAGAFTVGAIVEFSKSVGQTKMEFEAFERTMKAVTGSQTAAVSAMQSLADISSTLGLRLMDAAGGYKTLAAAARGTTLEGVGAKQAFEAVAQASSVLGLSAGDTSGVLLALGQMISKGKVQAEELRGQLGERLPGAFQIAARSMGVTTSELDKMLTTGGIATDVFLPKFTTELKKAFQSEAASAGNSGQAAFNRLQNAWDNLKLSLADTGSWDIAVAAANKLGKIAEAAAYSVRLATGSLQGAQKVYALEGDVSRKQEQIAALPDESKKVNVYVRTARSLGLAEDPADTRKKLQGELADLQRQLREEAQKIEDSAREQFGRQQQNAITSGYNKQLEAIKGGEKAVLDAWAGSSDKKVAAWATSQKEMREAYDKAAKGEITQGAMEALVSESQGKYGKALEDLAKKGGDAANAIAKANAEAEKLLNGAKFKAMDAELAAQGGSKYDLDRLKYAAEYQDQIDALEEKLIGFKGAEKEALEASAKGFYARELAAKNAKSQLDQFWDSMAQWGDLQQQLGEATFDPSRVMAGSMTKLQEERARALQAVQGDSEKTAMVMEIYAARETEIQRKGVRDRSDLKRKEIEARLGFEDSFGGYLKDRLALQYGLYKDASAQQLELWEKTADATIELFDGVMESFTWALGQGFGDLLTGKFKDVENYTEQLLAQLKNVFANWLTEMARIAANKYIVYPIMGQIVGTSGSLSLPGASGLNTQGGDGFSLEGAMKYGGYAKDAYSLFGGSGGAGAASLASEAAQGANFVGPSVQLANAGVPGSAQLTTAGALGAGAAAGGLGYAFGSVVRPDNPLASYVGAGAGLAAGTIAGMAGLGMLASTGVGALIAIPAALAVGLAQPNTVKSEWSVPNASKSAIMIAGGENTNAAYGVIKQTSSGAFGSSSTSHKSIFGIASPEMAAQQDAAWAAATKGLDGFTKAVGVSSDQLTSAKSSFNFPAIPIPDGMDAEVYRNVANAEAEHALTQLGMLDAIKAVTKDGEAYIDTLTRLDSTFSIMENLAISTGFGLEQVAGGLDRIAAANKASRLMEAAGGADAFAAAMARLNTYGYTAQEQMERSLTGSATATGRAIAEIGDASVTIENFWVRFRQATAAGLDESNVAAWTAASARMAQWEEIKASWQQRDIEALQQQTSTLQAQISVIQQVSSAWKGFGDQMVRLKQSLLMDANLSTLSPLEKMGAAKSRLDSLTSEANNKSTDHLADIDQATKDYLTSALDYYGASADYFAIFDSTSATIDQLQALAGSQVSAADQQIAQLNMTIEQNNAQITALNTINSGLGDVVNAVNNVSAAIGGAIQTANAAQQAVSIPQWAASAVAADSAAAASPYAAPAQLEGQANYLAVLEANGWGVPKFAGGGTTKGGWFVAGEDPLSSNSGELMYSASPVRVFNNKQSRAMLSGGQGGGDTKGIESRLDALNRRIDALLELTATGNRDRQGGNYVKRGQLLEQARRRA
ncbi:MAG: tape measure protein [Acidobacteriota bacterium]